MRKPFIKHSPGTKPARCYPIALLITSLLSSVKKQRLSHLRSHSSRNWIQTRSDIKAHTSLLECLRKQTLSFVIIDKLNA